MCDGRPETQKGVEDRGGAADVEVAEGGDDMDDAKDGGELMRCFLGNYFARYAVK